MRSLFLSLALLLANYCFSQAVDSAKAESLLKELAESVCKCADTISVINKKKAQIADEISKCIDAKVGAYQLSDKLLSTDLTKDAKEVNGKKQVNISFNPNKDSKEYKKYYWELERYLMANCDAVKEKIASNDHHNRHSLSSNPAAVEIYNKGLDEAKKENYAKAIEYYQDALRIDSQFAFAWDNLGLSYRKQEMYDKAIEAYQQSLLVDPNGIMPLQNIAIVYQYKKEYNKAIEAYQKLALLDENNPEVFYGIGQVYTFYFQDLEKGLTNMCKAYNLYTKQKSPYRSDAEKVIQAIYKEMKGKGNEDRFIEILKENNISTN